MVYQFLPHRDRLSDSGEPRSGLSGRSGLFAAAACLALLGSGLAACEPVIAHRGYMLDEKELAKVKPGMQKEEVRQIMGSPSTVSSIDGEAWYYITSTFETQAFFKPEEVDRTVVAVYFDRLPTVQQIGYYGLQDGIVVDLVTRTTPTRGKEISVLGQLLGNIGRYNRATDQQKTGPGR